MPSPIAYHLSDPSSSAIFLHSRWSTAIFIFGERQRPPVYCGLDRSPQLWIRCGKTTTVTDVLEMAVGILVVFRAIDYAGLPYSLAGCLRRSSRGSAF